MPRLPRQITAGPTARAKHGIHDLPPNVRVHQPGEKGYHGPRTRIFEGAEGKEDLRAATSHANFLDEERAASARRTPYNRGLGKVVIGTTAGSAGLIAAGTPFARRNYRKRTEKNQKRVQILNAVGKSAFHAADPGIRHVKNVKGVHDVSGMPLRVKRTFADKVGDYAERHPRAVEATSYGGILAGTGVLYAGTTGPRKKYERSQKDLVNAQGRARRRLKAQQVTKRAPKPTEYSPGQPLERFSAERRRRGIATESVAYGGAAATTGAAAVGLSNAKIAGTRVGQKVLRRTEARLRLSNNPEVAVPVRRLRRVGQTIARHPGKTSAAIGGLYAGAAGLGSLSRMRANEEEGISQGVGRIKAGEAYSRTKRHVLGKSVGWTLARGALMATDVDPKNPKLVRTARFVHRHAGKIALGALGTGGTAAVIGANRAGYNRARQTKELRRAAREPVGKSSLLAGGKGFATAAALTGGGSAGTVVLLHRKGHDDAANRVAAGTAGGWAGQGAYQGVTYGLKHKALRANRGTTKAALNRKLKPVKAKHGAFTPEMYRNYPTDAPAWRTNRALGHIARGKKGTAIGAATTATGAIGAAHLASRQGNQNKKVAKALYAREERLSPLRVLQLGAGAGLAAWGLGRSPVLGAALARGLKIATGKNNRDAMTALQYAMAAQGALRRGTAPAEHSLRQVRRINDAINRVPAALRPELAATAGLLLAGHAGPVHTTSYRPVSMTVRPRAYGW
ncbi:MAG TPA: hypothetical protein VIT65_22240 [Microlunatus sp.]